MENDLKAKSINSFAWKIGQSVCTLGMTFLIQIVLARILSPEDFGIIGIATVFMTLANTIIETSFSSAIIQRNSLNQKLTSSVFYANLFLSLAVYAVLFFTAPAIAAFYDVSVLIPILRVQGIRVIISGFYAIPQSFLNRKMKFKEIFFCSLAGSIVQAIVGFGMAYMGAGIWALVISTLASCVVSGIAMIILEPWRPSIYFSFKQVKSALAFSSNILAIRVIRKVFYNVRVLAIGKVYDTEILGLFNKGFQFPSTAMTVVDGSLTPVAFTSLAKLQNNVEKLTSSLRQYVRIMMFLCTPIMVGMALVAKPMVVVLLTDKWIDCVPFLQIICFTQLLITLNVKTTALEALGESGISMKLQVSGIILSIILLLASIPFSALVMTFSGLISTIILQIAVAIVVNKRLKYSIKEQLEDIFCALIPTAAMILAVVAVSFIPCGYLLSLCLEIIAGVAAFILVSILTKNTVFSTIWNIVRSKLRRR